MLEHFRTRDKQLLEQLGAITAGLVDAAKLLHRLLSGSAAEAVSIAAAARKLDTAAPGSDDTIDVRAFTGYAMRLDNQEYRSLAIALDMAFDSVQSATAHAYSLRAVNAAPPLRALAKLLVDASVMLHARVPEAGRRRSRRTRVGSASELLERGDTLYYEGVGALFSGSPDASDTLRWKDVYDTVHQSLARCVDAADVLSRLVP